MTGELGTSYWTGWRDGRDWQARHDVNLLVRLAERILDEQQMSTDADSGGTGHERPRLRLVRGGAS